MHHNEIIGSTIPYLLQCIPRNSPHTRRDGERRGGDNHERISLNPCIRLQPNTTNFAHNIGAMIVCTAYYLSTVSLKYSRDTYCALRT